MSNNPPYNPSFPQQQQQGGGYPGYPPQQQPGYTGQQQNYQMQQWSVKIKTRMKLRTKTKLMMSTSVAYDTVSPYYLLLIYLLGALMRSPTKIAFRIQSKYILYSYI